VIILEDDLRGSKSDRKDEASSKEKSSRRPRTERAFAIIGALASLVVIVGVIIAGIEHTSIFQRHREEEMVSNLIPGNDYARMVQLIGAEPDFHEGLKPGEQLYVFNRPWEYIQLLVNSSGTVVSVGVYAKTTSFKATLVDGIMLNGPSIGYQPYSPSGAAGSCGASWFDYYQGYVLPASGDNRSVIFGELPVTDTNEDMRVGSACSMFLSGRHCIAAYYRNDTQGLSARLLNCLKSLNDWRQVQSDSPTSVVIITAPSQPIVPDMLNTDYFFKT
jgi:hypothetical protein